MTPAFRIAPAQQLSPPPGRLPHPFPPQVPHSSAQQISLLNTLCGHFPEDTGLSVGEFEGFPVGDFVVGSGVGDFDGDGVGKSVGGNEGGCVVG